MAVKVLLSLCCVGACGLAMYLYHILWLVPRRVLAEFRMQGIGGPPPSFPYGNIADMREAVAAAKAARASARRTAAGGGGGIRHDYRPAVLPYYEKWRKEHGTCVPIFKLYFHSILGMIIRHACFYGILDPFECGYGPGFALLATSAVCFTAPLSAGRRP